MNSNEMSLNKNLIPENLISSKNHLSFDWPILNFERSFDLIDLSIT
jgi:hypothetical protein